MRALVVIIFVLASYGLNPLLAQERGKAPVTEQQPAQVQGDPKSAQTGSQDNDETNKRRVMERQGPGIDWDHRKPGRDWKISPRREDGTAKGERD